MKNNRDYNLVNQRGDEDSGLSHMQDENTVSLYKLAKSGNASGLRVKLAETLQPKDPKLVTIRKITDLPTDNQLRTLLHNAASLVNRDAAEETVSAVLSFAQENGRYNEGFVNQKDIKGDSALHCAAKSMSEGAVRKLLNAGANVTLRNEKKISAMELICAAVPQAISDMYDKAVELGEDFDPTDKHAEIRVNLTSVIGASSSALVMESDILYHALENPLKRRKELLTNAVVQLFLELKWRKLQLINMTSIFIHLLWLWLSVIFVIHLFLTTCPLPKHMLNDTSIPEDTPSHPKLRAPGDTCNPLATWWSSLWFWASLSLTAVVFLMEFLEMVTQIFQSKRARRRYFGNPGNFFQWLNIGLLATLFIDLELEHAVWDWMYYVAVFILILSGTLTTTQAGNVPMFAPLIQELARVFYRAVKVIAVFFPVIVGFALAFRVLSSGTNIEIMQFSSIQVSMTKTFAMATGDITFDSIMDSKVEAAFPLFLRILFVIFIVFVVLTLYNYIVSYSVSTIQELLKTADVDKMANLLEQIHLMESFMFQCYRRCNCLRWLYARQLIVPPRNRYGPGEDARIRELTIRISDIPHRLRDKLVELGRRNAESGGLMKV